MRKQAAEAMQFGPWVCAGLHASCKAVDLGQVAGRDPQPPNRESTYLVALPVGERGGYEVGDALQRGVKLLEVALAHSAVVVRAAGASSVMTWT